MNTAMSSRRFQPTSTLRRDTKKGHCAPALFSLACGIALFAFGVSDDAPQWAHSLPALGMLACIVSLGVLYYCYAVWAMSDRRMKKNPLQGNPFRY